MGSVAITDHANMYGVIEFYKAAKDAGIKPIIGCEMYIVNDMYEKTLVDNKRRHITLLAKNNVGYQNLIKLVSKANLDGFYYKPRIDMDLLTEHSEGLVCLSGCLGGQLSQYLLEDDMMEARIYALKFKKMFGDDYYIELQRHDNNEDQAIVTPKLIELAKEEELPMVATTDCHYLEKNDNISHDVLLAIQTGKTLKDENRLSFMDDYFHVMSNEEMTEKFSDLPEAIQNTQEIADKCNVDIELGESKLPTIDVPEPYETPEIYLSRLCWDKVWDKYGIKKAMAPETLNITERLSFELKVIKNSGFASYILIVSDIINWAKSQGIVVGPGRGSAAGSIISYILGITNLDPIEYGLLFERFMNPARISMPDIDIDFEDTRREEVIKYVADKYGEDHVAQIITFGTMFARTAIRDVGRVMEHTLPDCDRIAKAVPFGMSIKEALESNSDLIKEYNNEKYTELIDTALSLEGVVRHASKHACGVVISDKPITDYSPIQSSKDGGVMTQYEMGAIEELGLLKMDFLGLRNLSVISECIKLVKGQLGIDIDINKIPLDNSRAFKLLQNGQTTCVFQLESGGMKRYLQQLKPTDIDDIIVMVSLYRPGPMELIPEYIKRKHGKSKVEYLHPVLEPILKDTYGIMIFQEQLIKAVQALAGFSLAEADVLRKAVGKKIKKLMDEQESKFKDGCENNNIPKNIANRFWALIEPFNKYGFNKSHAACYALIAYQTAYLKSNYPLQFMVAEMNSNDSIDRITELMIELKNIGINMAEPQINESGSKFSGNGDKIRFSLSGIKGIGSKVADKILQERENGEYTNLQNFIMRVGGGIVNKKILGLLAKTGAFEGLEERNRIIESLPQIVAYAKLENKEYLPELVLPKKPASTVGQKMAWEKELIGFYVSANPASNYYHEISTHGVLDIARLFDSNRENVKVGGVITDFKKITTKAGKNIYKIRLLDMSGELECTIFQGVYNKNKELFVVNNIVVLSGKINKYMDRESFACFSGQVIATMA